MSKETLSELAHQIEVEMDKESLKESELRLTTKGQITKKTVEKKYFLLIKPEICLTKYHNIPTNRYTHIAMQCMRRMALYNKATGELVKKSNQKNELAPCHSVAFLPNPKPNGLYCLTSLSPSLFTVMSFTRVLCSLTLWEILLPASAVAIDFIRTRIVDMSTEEYFDWLCQVSFPFNCSCINH
ncbi:uncharacterized protein DC041_0011740 [Schistosoma bovis]|uniref:Uncharacterized protein n=1 Tax=Schistosoma bovis TaxID=6184 RepID=A0A430PZ75_SCHBO|nr:uncharacterized protein DC041_0011740 [Schistosoma bovis]